MNAKIGNAESSQSVDSINMPHGSHGMVHTLLVRAAAIGIALAASCAGMAAGAATALGAPAAAGPIHTAENNAICKNVQENSSDSNKSAIQDTYTGADAQEHLEQKIKDSGVTKRCRARSVHTDAMSTYLDKNNQLVQKSRADNVYEGAGNEIRYDSDAMLFVLDDQAKTPAPSETQYAFLRDATKDTGGNFWYIPQTWDDAHKELWAGFSTQALNGNSHIDASKGVSLKLTDFHGPSGGQMYMWEESSFGNIIQEIGSPDTGWPDTHDLSTNQHEHMNWAFTMPGRYTFTYQATATVDGKQVSVSQEYTFAVGDDSFDVSKNAWKQDPSASSVTVAPAADVTPTNGKPADFEANVSVNGFSNPQGWVVFSQGDTQLGYSKVINGKATYKVPSYDSAGTITAHYVPRFAEEAASADGIYGKEPLPDPEDIEASGIELKPVQSGDTVATIVVKDGDAIGQPVYVNVLNTKADGKADMASSVSQGWYTVGAAGSNGYGTFTIPIPAADKDSEKTYVILVRLSTEDNPAGQQVGTATLTVAKQVDYDGGESGGTGDEGDNTGDQDNPGNTGNTSGSSGQSSVQDQMCTTKDFYVLDHEHTDIAAYTSVDAPFRMAVQSDLDAQSLQKDLKQVTRVRLSPSKVVIWVKPGAKVSGENVWQIPQTQNYSIIWLGWNNQSLAPKVPVTWKLNSLKGPGNLTIWTQGNLGAGRNIILSNTDASHKQYLMEANTHTHANWSFTAQGYYTLNITYSSSLGSQTENVYIAVGNVNPRSMPVACNVANQAKNSGLTANVNNAKLASLAGTEDAGAQPLTPLEQQSQADQDTSAESQSQAAQEPVVITVPAVTNILSRHPVMATTLVAGGSILSTLCIVFTGIEMRKRLAGL